jgi:polyisoprenoid-binding protein YceI
MATVTVLRYALDTVHSSIGFRVKAHGLASFRSSFARHDAEVKDVTIGDDRVNLQLVKQA